MKAEPPAWIVAVGAQKVDVIGVVAEPVRFGPDRAVVLVSVQRLALPNQTVPVGGRIRLTVRGSVPPLVVGDVIEFTTRLHPPRGLWNPAGYDYGAHLRRAGVHAVGSVGLHRDGAGVRILARGFSSLLAAVDQGRARIRDAALRTLEDPIAGIYLALVTVGLVAWDPLAPCDMSSQLSFVSVLVIIMLMKIRRPRDEETTLGAFRERRTWEALKAGTVDVLLVSLVVTLASAPLVATYFNQLAWVGGLSNLLVVPLVGFLVLPVGLLVCLATLLSGAGGELVGAAVVRPLLEVLVWVVQTCAAVPGAELRVASPPVWQMAGFFLLLGVALIWWRCGAGRLAGALAGGLLLLWVWSPRDLPAAGTFRVTFLDVGQGDAALVETADGRAMLIDGGAATDAYDAGPMVIAPVLWDRGIRRLDVVVAPHPQLDHVD